MTKKILVGMPTNLLNLVDQTAGAECRTRSDLVREALRRYIDEFHKQRIVLSENALNIRKLENSLVASISPGNQDDESIGYIQRF